MTPADMALLVYEGSEHFAGHFTNIMPLREENDYAVVLSNHLHSFVVFSGTDDSADVWDDLDFFSEYHKGFGKVHGGFMESYQRLSKEITQYLHHVHYTGSPVACVGHSKGGAMALLCGLDLVNKGMTDCRKVITFGCPRVGKGEFCRRVKQNLIHDRHVNGKDPVPRVPRSYMGFRHDCAPIAHNDGWWSWGWIGDPKDHSMVRYREQYNVWVAS